MWKEGRKKEKLEAAFAIRAEWHVDSGFCTEMRATFYSADCIVVTTVTN